MMSPSYFAVRNAELDEQIEAARLAGDFPRVYELLAEQTSLVRSMHGAARPELGRTTEIVFT